MPLGERVQGFPATRLLRDLPLELDTVGTSLAMAFVLRKPSSPCQITNLNLSGPRGALQRKARKCRRLTWLCKTHTLAKCREYNLQRGFELPVGSMI